MDCRLGESWKKWSFAIVIGLNQERRTFRKDPEKTKFQTVACMNEWMHQAGHESSEHLGLSRSVRFRSVIEVGALGIYIVLQGLVNSLSDQLVGEEFEVRLIVLLITEMINKVVN